MKDGLPQRVGASLGGSHFEILSSCLQVVGVERILAAPEVAEDGNTYTGQQHIVEAVKYYDEQPQPQLAVARLPCGAPRINQRPSKSAPR